jgi:hypothetical protein
MNAIIKTIHDEVAGEIKITIAMEIKSAANVIRDYAEALENGVDLFGEPIDREQFKTGIDKQIDRILSAMSHA